MNERDKQMKKGVFGLSSTGMYRIWSAMIERCEVTTNRSYHRYGGRGIKVCERWRKSFIAFLLDMGMRREGMSLDRIDVNGDYEPSNCRWASNKEQCRNKRNNLLITVNDRTQCAAAWEEEMGLPEGTVAQRINANGLSPQEAVLRPLKGTVQTPIEVRRARKRAANKKHQDTDRWREKHRLYMYDWRRRRALGG